MVNLDDPRPNPEEARPIDAVVKKEKRRLFDFIRRRIGNEAEAEDLLQDVLYQLASNYSVAEPIENLTAWLFTVARNRVIDWYRKRRPAPLPQASGDEDRPLGPEEILFDLEDGPDRAYWRTEVWSELSSALEDLPAAQREVFVAHEIEGVSFKEIAQRTGEPLNTLLSRKRYAVLFLRERLRDLYDEMALRPAR
jgi:RNA polymerase sigma factor (sigma-70 family)